MSEQAVFVFNQYYWDLLKKCKDRAKQQKETSKPARNILRAIRSNYMSFDKSSREHLDAFKAALACDSFWETYTTKTLEEIEALEFEGAASLQVFNGISLADLCQVMQHTYLLHQYVSLLGLLTTVEDPKPLVDTVKSFTEDEKYAAALESITDAATKAVVERLHTLYKRNTHISMDSGLRDIENTSLGKLAKEIMDEVNVDELQKTLGGGNIAEVFQNPSGLTNLLSTVSQKMVSKMASGELKQEQLLQDAVNIATKLPSMLPGGMSKDFANIGNILGNLTSMMGATGGAGAGAADGDTADDEPSSSGMSGAPDLSNFDLGAMASMMSNLMKQPKAKTHAATARMNSEMKRQALAKKLKKRLDAQKKAQDDLE